MAVTNPKTPNVQKYLESLQSKQQSASPVVVTQSTTSSVDVTDRKTRVLGSVVVTDMPVGSAGLTDLELRASPVPVSGTVTATTGGLTDAQLRATAVPVSLASTTVTINAGDIEIGAVELKNGTDDTRATITASNALKVDGSAVTQPVSGTFWQATQPVSGTVAVTQSGTWDEVGINDSGNSITVDGTFWQATQPVSAASLPLPSGASTSALQTQPGVDIGDVTVNNASGASAVNVQDGGNSLTVDGAVAATQSGTWTVQPGNTANTTAWKVDGSAVTQPVSGTVTATISSGASTIAKAEDVASANADVGVPAMAIQKATPSNTAGTDGDYEMLQISAGRLWTSTKLYGTLVDLDNAAISPDLRDGVALLAPGSGGHQTINGDAANGLDVDVTRLPSLVAGSAVIGHVIADSGSTTAVTQATGTNLHTVVDSGTVTTVSTVTNLSQLGGVAVAMNTGVRSTGTQRVTIATDDLVPVSAASLPLPSGAATAALQPALGTATSPSANVITTQRPAVTQVVSTALEASHVLKASAGQIMELSVFNSKSSAQFILLMNSTTVPSNGAVTLLYPPIPISANTLLVIDFPYPLVASTGIAICNSSTGTFTKTIGSADCAFYAQIN